MPDAKSGELRPQGKETRTPKATNSVGSGKISVGHKRPLEGSSSSDLDGLRLVSMAEKLQRGVIFYSSTRIDGTATTVTPVDSRSMGFNLFRPIETAASGGQAPSTQEKAGGQAPRHQEEAIETDCDTDDEKEVETDGEEEVERDGEEVIGNRTSI